VKRLNNFRLLLVVVVTLWNCSDETVTLPSPGPSCLVSPDSINLGTVKVGDSADTTITILNFDLILDPNQEPAKPFTINVSASCPHYSISGLGQRTLASNEHHLVRVRFRPTSAGTHRCTIDTGASFCRDVHVVGVGVP